MGDPKVRRQPRPARRRWALRLLALGGWGVFGLFLVGLVGLAALALGYHRYIVRDPGDHVAREHILSIIAQESPVYYRDGKTRIGVFFEAEHRQYVAPEELPLAWSVSIVASEDERFWSHPGVDLWGLSRAMRDNLLAGRLVAGGSTLTQQTAKNLYYRPDRSLRSKGIELLNALKLERHYNKLEILGFYANQFHVTGNGRGLAIGARYFFDKDVEELTLAEAAFLAGLVKAPSRYDPFHGDEERRARALAHAHGRTRYVLRRITEVPPEILAGPHPVAEVQALQTEAARLLQSDLQLDFTKGTFRYQDSAVLDEVARRLAEPPFRAVLAAHGIQDPATAGLVVITTLDAHAQRAATYGLWHHLTEVGSWLEELGPEAFIQEGHSGPAWAPELPVQPQEFRWARVTERIETPRKHLRVDLGGRTCVVDRDALVRVAVASVRGKKGDRNAKASTAEVDAFAEAFPIGSVVLVSVRSVPAQGEPVCDLEVRPELQGAVLVVENGEIRAMVGGNDNRHFNRATALRQMGSTWKPLVFHAALQLGWSPDDPLDNQRNVFPFSTTFYYPRPDHEPPPTVSMAWTGVRSENLSTVWLLYHLIDKLDGEGVRALAQSLDLARRHDEPEEAYRLRIQKAGVLPTRARVAEGLFLQARQEVLAGLDRSAHPEDALALQSLLYGWGFDAERKRVAREGPRTRAWKERALDNSWRHLEPMIEDCALQHAVLETAMRQRTMPSAQAVPDLSVLLDGDVVRVACGALPEGYVRPDTSFLETLLSGEVEEVEPDDEEADEEPEPARALGSLFRRRNERVGLPRLPLFRPKLPRLVDVEDVRVDDRLRLGTLREVREALHRRERALELAGAPDLYSPEVLYWHQDFRVLLALRYVSALAERYGVQTELQQVLSLPLGASEITLEEAVSVYAGITTGQSWTFSGRSGDLEMPSPPAPTLLIAEIRDVDGRVLYAAEPRPERVAARPTGHMTADILRNVVRFGTGRRALHAITLGGAPVPVGGKTGTTNDFRNAAFLGFVPTWTQGGFGVDEGFVIGAYVGYDDNRPMVNGRIRLAGASGALPAWMGAAQGLAQAGLLGAPEGQPQGGSWPLTLDEELVPLPVDDTAGLPLEEGVSLLETDPNGPTVWVARRPVQEELEFRPVDRPARIAPRTDDAEQRRGRRIQIWRD